MQKYDPDHLIMQLTHEEAMRGLVDFGRIEEMIERTKGHVDHVQLTRVSPLAAPMMLEMGRVPIAGEGRERLLADAAETLMHDSGLRDIGP